MFRLPHQSIERTVRCPSCNRTYKTPVSTRWYYKELRRTFGFPEMECVPCLDLRAAVEAGQVPPDTPPNLERAPC